MKYVALSVKQPWANLIASGRKTLEIRSWSTSYRGPLLVCSSRVPKIEPYGQAVCLVDLVDIIDFRPEDLAKSCLNEWIPGKLAWVLKDARPVIGFPVKGRLHTYLVEADLQFKTFQESVSELRLR